MFNAPAQSPFGIKLALFDIDGVVVPEERTLDRRRKVYLVRRLHRDHQIPPRLFRPFFSDVFHECLVGRRDLREALAPYLETMRWKGTVDDFLYYWFSAESVVDDRMLSVVARLRAAGVRCVLASNQERYRAAYLLHTVGLKDHFDGWFFSYGLGHTKYALRFYEKLLSRFPDVEPKDMLYWDDMQLYVSNARKLGINAHLYVHFERFERVMADYFPGTVAYAPGRQSYRGVRAEVARLLQDLYADESLSIRKQSGGSINQVFEVTTLRHGQLMVKLHADRSRVALFQRAQDVTERVRALGVPVPQILHVGNTRIPYAYATYAKLPGREGSDAPDSLSLWKKIGSYARLLNTVRGEGYGTLEFWREKPLLYHPTWHEYVGMQREQLLGGIAQRGLLSAEHLREARHHLSDMQGWEFQPHLVHGNLALKNTLVSRHGEVTGMIDWDDAFFSRVPHHELARTLPWITAAEAQAFLSGYGISAREWETMEREVWQLQLLTYLDYMNWFDTAGQGEQLREFRGRVAAVLAQLAKPRAAAVTGSAEQR